MHIFGPRSHTPCSILCECTSSHPDCGATSSLWGRSPHPWWAPFFMSSVCVALGQALNGACALLPKGAPREVSMCAWPGGGHGHSQQEGWSLSGMEAPAPQTTPPTHTPVSTGPVCESRGPVLVRRVAQPWGRPTPMPGSFQDVLVCSQDKQGPVASDRAGPAIPQTLLLWGVGGTMAPRDSSSSHHGPSSLGPGSSPCGGFLLSHQET